jgi:hypothetical protein
MVSGMARVSSKDDVQADTRRQEWVRGEEGVRGEGDAGRDGTVRGEPGVVTTTRTRRRSKLQKPTLFKVLLHNDDFTTRDFVVEVLRMVFHKNESDAVRTAPRPSKRPGCGRRLHPRDGRDEGRAGDVPGAAERVPSSRDDGAGMSPNISRNLQRNFRAAIDDAHARRHEFLTLEHILLAIARDRRGADLLRGCGANPRRLALELERFLDEEVETLPEGDERMPVETIALRRLLAYAAMQAEASEQESPDVGNIIVALFRETRFARPVRAASAGRRLTS